jgi:hypothetical protein
VTAARVPGIPDHLLVDEAGHTAACAVCGMSVKCPSGRFGPVSASDMLAAFVVDHAVHDRSGMPNGLTPAGKPRKAAAAVVEAAMRGEGGT